MGFNTGLTEANMKGVVAVLRSHVGQNEADNDQVVVARSRGGIDPAVRRICHTVDAATFTPRVSSPTTDSPPPGARPARGSSGSYLAGPGGGPGTP
jgi:hypothetical protein